MSNLISSIPIYVAQQMSVYIQDRRDWTKGGFEIDSEPSPEDLDPSQVFLPEIAWIGQCARPRNPFGWRRVSVLTGATERQEFTPKSITQRDRLIACAQIIEHVRGRIPLSNNYLRRSSEVQRAIASGEYSWDTYHTQWERLANIKRRVESYEAMFTIATQAARFKSGNCGTLSCYGYFHSRNTYPHIPIQIAKLLDRDETQNLADHTFLVMGTDPETDPDTVILDLWTEACYPIDLLHQQLRNRLGSVCIPELPGTCPFPVLDPDITRYTMELMMPRLPKHMQVKQQP